MMKMFVVLKLMPLFWQGHAQDEDFLIQMGQKNELSSSASDYAETYKGWCIDDDYKFLLNHSWQGFDNSTNCRARCDDDPECIAYEYNAGSTDTYYACYILHQQAGVGDITQGTQGLVTSDSQEVVTCYKKTQAQPAGAYGDPHCVNAKGDWFDIHAVGRIPMVILPSGTSIENSDFAVIATTTTPDGWDKCAPTFISAVDVWANQTHDQLRVDAGPAGDLQVKPMIGSTEAYSIKMLSEKVMITFRSVIVSVILNKVPKIDQAPFLYFDMEVAGLQALNAGGILGADPHDFAQVQPDGCSEVPFKHRAVGRYSMARAMP